MIVYSVTCRMNAEIAKEWEAFFINKHLKDVLNTGCFTRYSFRKEITDNEREAVFTADYYALNQNSFERYHRDYAPKLKAETMALFEGKFTCSRTLSTLISEQNSLEK